jgi:hypothetical protein
VAAPLIPTPFDEIGRRPFLFYPAIVGIEHNEWMLRRVGPSEVQVLNTKTSEELWIPRRFLGEVSAIEDPFLIAGLVKELEYKDGVVLPHRRRVIEMPRAVNGGSSTGLAHTAEAGSAETIRSPMRAMASSASVSGPAQVIGIRVESGPSSRVGKRLFTWTVAGILVCVITAEALLMFGHRRIIRDPRGIRP